MRENSWGRQLRCSLATPATRWRCAVRCHRWMLVILLWTVLAAKSMAGPAPGPGSSLASGSEVQSLALRVMESDERCAEIRSILAEKVKTVSDTTDGIDNDDTSVSSQPQHPRVCSLDSICCPGQMQQLLVRQSERELKKSMNDKMKTIKQTFMTWTAKFDSFFRGLLDRSKRNLYDLFDRSYGSFFQSNSQIFIQLYSDLRSHYSSDEMNLDDVLDGFFTALLRRMFSLLNDDLELTEEYLQCVEEHMDLLRPFNDVPQRLQSEIRRSFLVARSFVQGLSQGKEIVLIMAKQSPDDECSKMMARMLFCQFCQGHSSAARPCFDFCLTTVSQCLSNTIELQDEWTKYLNDLLRLGDRLSGPFNIESVVSLLDVKISEAIMSYQENSSNVTTLARQNCGNPVSKTRKKRQLTTDDATETPPQPIPSSASSSSRALSSSRTFKSARSSSSSVPTSSSVSPTATSSSSSSSSASSSFSSSSSPFSSSSSNSSSSSPSPTTPLKSRQRQQQQKQQRQRQQQVEQHGEEQPEQQEEQQEQQTQRQPELQEGQDRTPRPSEEPPRRQHQQQQQQREEQPSQTKQQREQRRQQRQQERLQEEQRRLQQQEELARQQRQQHDEQQRQPLLHHQPQESDQYTEQPPVEEKQRRPLLSQPRESDQYIEQPPVEQQQQRQRLQQRQPADSRDNQMQREQGQPKKRQQQAKSAHRQQRPTSSEETLTELEQNLRDVRRKLEAVRTFWAELPLSVCRDVIAEPGNDTNCWNGVDMSRGEGVDSGHVRHPVQLTSIVRQQILKLRVASDKLRQAYNGWSENDLDGSGNGLDFGSGTEMETAPPPFEEIRTNAPEVAAVTENRATKTIRRLSSGSDRLDSDAILVRILLLLSLVTLFFRRHL